MSDAVALTASSLTIGVILRCAPKVKQEMLIGIECFRDTQVTASRNSLWRLRSEQRLLFFNSKAGGFIGGRGNCIDRRMSAEKRFEPLARL